MAITLQTSQRPKPNMARMVDAHANGPALFPNRTKAAGMDGEMDGPVLTYRVDSVHLLPDSILARNPQLLEMDAPKPNKYHANKTTIDGITFDSAKEGQRYQELLLLQRAGRISGLKRQTRFELQAGFVGMNGKWVRPIFYVADAEYWEGGRHIVEDTKSPITRKIKSYQIKKKLFEKRYFDIEFREA